MSFKLLIECSKDISSLTIDFADGTSTVQTSPAHQAHRVSKKSTEDNAVVQVQNAKRREVFLDTDADYSSVSQEVVQLPKISDIQRKANVAPELQNLDF